MKSMLLTLILLISAAACTDDNPVVPGGAGTPEIRFTAVPAMGTHDDLRGVVEHVDIRTHRIAVYIYVYGWWSKPTWASPLTSIGDDGAWSTDVTTGGNDTQATQFKAFLVPADYSPPQMSGQQELPDELLEHSLAYTEATR